VLGFNVFCDHAAWFEVLLATDRSLFDPANASRRKPENFYSSRQDSRLIAIQLGRAVYLAPAAVLRGFINVAGRPSEIYYTVVAYSDEQGSNPVFAQPPSALTVSAPSVAISRHYGSDGSWSAFGMDPSKLRRWQPPEMQPTGRPVSAGLSLGAASISEEEDRAGGEDGRYAPPPQPVNVEPHALDYNDGSDDEDWSQGTREYSDAGSVGRMAAADQDDYDDGYGEPPAAPGLMASLAQQISYRPGEPEPQELQDGYDEASYGRSAAYSERQRSSFAPTSSYDSDDVDEDDSDRGENAPERYAARRNGGNQPASRFVPSAAENGSYSDEADEGPWTGDSYQASAADGGAAPTPAPAAAPPLTIEKKRDLIGKLGEYTAVSADAEFNGVLGPDHPSYRRHHLGLSFGVVGFNQDAGHLGQLLSMMRERDPAKFVEIFGPDAEALLRVAAAKGPRSTESRDGRSARVQKVGGADLWEEPWIGRFREAGAFKPFQAVQNRLAAELFLDPILLFAHHIGLNTERALAMAMDRAANVGVASAEQWIATTCGPLQTPQQRQQALAALGVPNVRAFQAGYPGSEVDGQWGPKTHAAMVDALRATGRSPVPLPTLDQLLDAMVRRASQTPWLARIQALRNDVRLGDTPIHFEHRRQHAGQNGHPH
jgi:hypothetical protein